MKSVEQQPASPHFFSWATSLEEGLSGKCRSCTHDTPTAATDLALRLARELEVDHAGFDIALVEGYPYVLEFNRLFGNQGLGQGSDLKDAILDYLQRQSRPQDPDGPTEPTPLWPIAV